MRLVTLIAATILISGSAKAGDWSGSTVGVKVGGANPATGSMSNTSDGAAVYDVHGSHDIIIGKPVLGTEVEFSRIDLRYTVSGVEIGDVERSKFRSGGDFGPEYDLGQTLDTGVIYELGLSTTVGNPLRPGGEALGLVFNDFADSGTDLVSDSFSVRVSFRF